MKAANNYESFCRVRKFCRWVLSGLIIATLGAACHAAIFSWSGGSASDANWSDSENWGFVGTPGNGDTVIFPGGAARLINTNDIAGLTLSQIRFVGTSGGYQIYGNGFTITNGILATNTAGANSLSMTNSTITIATTNLSIVVSNGVTLAIWASLAGTPGLVKNGTGTLILEGPLANVYGGLTTVNAGLVQLAKNGNPAIPGDFVVGDGSDIATLQNIFGNEMSFPENMTINANGIWNMGGNIESVGTNITMNGNASIASAGLESLVDGITITANPGVLENCSISGSIYAEGPICNFVVNSVFPDGGLIVSANIGGATSIDKEGNGFLAFSGQNTFFYTEVNVSDGTLGVESTQALGDPSSGAFVSGTSTLAVYASVTNSQLFISSSGVGIRNVSGSNTLFCTNIVLAGTATVEVDGSGLELLGQITGSGGLTKTGASPLTLSGSGTENTYSGATVVSSGVLQLNKVGAHSIGSSSALIIGTGTNAAADSDVVRYINSNGNQINVGVPITVTESGLLDLNGDSGAAGPVTLNGGDLSTESGLFENSGTITVTSSNRSPTISGNLQMDGDSIVVDADAQFYSLIISAAISDIGSAGFSVTNGPNSGAFARLIGSNSFTGPLTISGLTTTAETPWALGSSNGPTMVNNGILFLYATQITNESVSLMNGSSMIAQNDCSWLGPVVLSGPSYIQDFDRNILFDIVGPISGTGSLISLGNGTNRLSGTVANTYNGLTTVTAGNTLLLDKSVANGAIPGNVVVNNTGTLRLANSEQIADAANVTVNSGGLFDFSTFFEAIDALTGSGSVTFGLDGFLKIGANNGTSTFNGLMSGTGYPNGYTVGKFGTGTFTMTANNTYQNGSDVFVGTLIVNGTQPQSPVRIMDSGTTLGGSGQVGDIVAALGTIAPGVAGSPAIFTCSNMPFASSGNFTVRLNGPNPGTGYDQLVVLGTNNLGNATLTVLPNFTQPVSIGQQFTIINNEAAGPIVGTFSGLPDGTIFSATDYYFRINYSGGSGNDVVLTLVGVPDKTVTLTSVDRGWYDSTGFNSPANPNYLCGGDAGNTTNFYRDWFVFDAPVSASSIIGAELIINCYASSNPQGGQTYLVRGVTTPIATLEAGGSGLVGIYDDLGSNAVYSERTVETEESGQFAIIPLNVKFINDITAAAGGQIALGGSIVSPSTNAYLFGGSGGGANDVQLRLTYGNSVTLNAADTGWYNDIGSHTAANKNYLAGTSGVNYHDYFVYNLPVVSGPLVYAQLLVSNYNISSPTNSNPFQLYDVTTPITTLTNNASGATATYDDLGSGVLYGGRDLYVSESGLQAGIPLDSEFVSDVYAHSGGEIALGGAVSSTNGYVFGASPSGGIPTDAQLWLGFLSAPATTPVFVNSSNIGNNMVQFALSGTSGTSNEIQGSFDFTNWDYMGDLYMTNTTSVFTYTNSSMYAPGRFPYRFFRAKLTP